MQSLETSGVENSTIDTLSTTNLEMDSFDTLRLPPGRIRTAG